MRAQLLHLSGPLRGRTVTHESAVVEIGRDPACTCVLDAEAVAPRHARIEFVAEQCAFHLRRLDGAVFVNGEEVEEVILQDDDQLEFGVGGPIARFHVYVPIGAACKPVRKMLADAGKVARVSGHLAATGTLTRDLLTQATLSLKVGFPVAVLGALLAVSWLGGWFGGWLGTRDDVREYRTVGEATHAELERLRVAQAEQKASIERLAAADATVRRIQQEWSRGVCLIHGVFRLRNAAGDWIVHRGQPLEIEYTGSGFLVSRVGHVMTNRHVALPWLDHPPAAALLESGATPEFVRFTATFPGLAPVPIDPARTVRRQDDLDVALVQVDPEAVAAVPALPLQTETDPQDDQIAIVVGYPTGLSALIARADPALVERLREVEATMTIAIDELAAAGQIAPLLTQGVVSEVRGDKLTYDAVTTHGGSGGPVFGRNGKVIAVNHAILQNYTGANFGVPVRFGAELLPR
jgi:S1-C subfamily serine protease